MGGRRRFEPDRRWSFAAIPAVLIAIAIVATLFFRPPPPDEYSVGWSAPMLAQHSLVPPPTGAALEAAYRDAATIIEQALASAIDLKRQGSPGPDSFTTGSLAVDWVPGGRSTLLPAVRHGDRIYRVTVLLDEFVASGGDVTAEIWFMGAGGARPASDAAGWTYRLDPDVGARLVDVMFRRH